MTVPSWAPFAAAGAVLLAMGNNAAQWAMTNTGLPNKPPIITWWNLWRLRSAAQATFPPGVRYTSAYRSDEVEESVGGSGLRHPLGKGLDVTPGSSGLSMGDLKRRARARADLWEEVFDEGDHVHVTLRT